MGLTKEQLREYDRKGLIPGPEETDRQFEERAAYCLELKNRVFDLIGRKGDFEKSLLPSAIQEADNFFHIRPDWAPVFFSNEKLAPWHGGCAWIFQENENGPTGACLQLRKVFRSHAAYLGIYRIDELAAHELAHAGRMMYQEPKYEEIIAYQTSRSAFRRYFGPIVQSTREAALFAALLLMILLADALALLTDPKLLFSQLAWLKTLPLLLAAAAGCRIWKRQKTFRKCLKNLQNYFQKRPSLAKAVIYRLTDKEIEEFSKQTVQKAIENHSRNNADSLHWRALCELYFFSSLN